MSVLCNDCTFSLSNGKADYKALRLISSKILFFTKEEYTSLNLELTSISNSTVKSKNVE